MQQWSDGVRLLILHCHHRANECFGARGRNSSGPDRLTIFHKPKYWAALISAYSVTDGKRSSHDQGALHFCDPLEYKLQGWAVLVTCAKDKATTRKEMMELGGCLLVLGAVCSGRLWSDDPTFSI